MKTVSDVQVTVRVDQNLKKDAEDLFGKLGMNMTTAINVFLRKAVSESAIPFDISLNNNSFYAGYTASDIEDVFQRAVKDEIRNKQKRGNPVVEYDSDLGKVYLLYPNGKKEYMNG